MTDEMNYKEEYEKLLSQQQTLKDATDKACHEAAEWKDKYRATLSENEKAEQERAEKDKALALELEGYRTGARIAGYKSRLVDCGYDPQTAELMAKTLPDGVSDDFFASHKAFMETKTKEIEGNALGKQPKPSVGLPASPSTDPKMERIRKAMGL